MNPTVGDNIAQAMRDKEAFLSPENVGDREQQARDILAILLSAVAKIAGPEVLAAAYGTSSPDDRASTLICISKRMWAVWPLFARLPDDGAGFESIMLEVAAIANGDDPQLFARLPDQRKNPMRLARAKLSALLWDAYLKASGESPAERHGFISSCYGQEWDTIERWSKQVRSKLGTEFVKYHMNVAIAEGATGKDFSWGDDTPYGFERVPASWQDRLQRDGRAFVAAMNANAGRLK